MAGALHHPLYRPRARQDTRGVHGQRAPFVFGPRLFCADPSGRLGPGEGIGCRPRFSNQPLFLGYFRVSVHFSKGSFD